MPRRTALVLAAVLATGCGGPEDKNFPPLSDTGGGSFPGPSVPGGPITTRGDGLDDGDATAGTGGDDVATSGATIVTTDISTTEDTLPDVTFGDTLPDATVGDFTFGDEADDLEGPGPTTLTTGPLTTG